MMRAALALGRPFTDAEGEIGNEKKLLLSDSLWRSLFASDPGVVGKEMRIDGEPNTIVGVMPRSFERLAPGTKPGRRPAGAA